MNIKLIRKQRYTIETIQEVEIDEQELKNYEGDYDDLFYDAPEVIKHDDYVENFFYPDRFNFIGYNVYLHSGDVIKKFRLDNKVNLFDLEDWDKDIEQPLAIALARLKFKKINK